MWGYQLYFGADPNGVAYQNVTAVEPRQWTPYPAGVPTGVYYLRGRARDIAGNWSAWTNLFTFRYDGTPPENPANVTHTAGITSTVWQRLTNTADFTWPAPHDEGSGIKGYVCLLGDGAGWRDDRCDDGRRLCVGGPVVRGERGLHRLPAAAQRGQRG